MKTSSFRKFVGRLAAGIVSLFLGAPLCAAPLAWFPGPSLDLPASGAAAVVSGGNNVLIGGDAYAYYYYPLTYPLSLGPTNSSWSYLSPLYSLNIAPGAVASGGLIILYGGTDGSNSTSAVIGYDPSGDTPQTLASMSVARSYLAYAADRDGNAYAIGGLDDRGQPLASAERCNSDSDLWTAIAPLPTPLYQFPAVSDHTNSIYIFGGRTNTTSGAETAVVLRYSVSANKWTAMAPLPIAVAGSVAALGVDGKIYVVGGLSGGVATDAVQIYNPAANSWVMSTPLPEGLSGAAMGVDSLGRLIVTGGIDTNGNDVSDVWRSQQLGAPDTPPGFVSYPGLSATYHVPYVSSITATGSPPPRYEVWSGPAGLEVDTYSGAITWTPQADQIGTNSVTIRATNYSGFADWTFAIAVAPPSPTIPTNLTVVALTENSVTFSWDPEDPLVGPVTYRVYERHVTITRTGGYATYNLVGTVSSPRVTIVGLQTGTSHTFTVVAAAAGGTSAMSQFFTVKTLVPQAPANLRVTGLTSTTITLAWDASPGPVPIASYEIWGWINNGVTSAIYATGLTSTTATITGLVPGSTHEWGVRGHDAGGYASAFDYGPTVMNPAPVASSLSPAAPSVGGFQFTVQLAQPQTTFVQATTNPADPAAWSTIATNPPTTGTFTFTDPDSSLYPMRFYRVVSP